MFDVNEFILKKAKELGFGDVVVLGYEMDRRQVRFANNEITVAKNWHERKVELFVELDKRIAGTSITELSEENIERTLKALLSTLKNMAPKEDYYGIAEGPFEYIDIPETFDKAIVELDEPNEYVERAINAALEERAKRVAGVLYTDHNRIYLTTSNGVEAFDEGTGIEISVRAFIGDLESGHGTNSVRILKKFDPESAGRKAGEIAKMAQNPEQGPEGKFDVIFDPLAFANLLSYMSFMTSAYAAEAGFSFLAGKLGQKVANEDVTIKDVGNMPNAYGTRKFDDEGVPTRETMIIENGTFKTFLLNTSLAKKYETETTANAGLAMPHAWNILLEPGDYTKEELFSEVKKGIYITNVWYTRFQNYVTGDFSTIPRDGIFLVENGELKPIRNIRVSDNFQRILENISALGKDIHHIHWWEVRTPVFTPYVVVKDVGITRATK
ncbi:TldD/PmbA family protein [Thermococcus sp. GR7]|uniref:TldD/PmbA family protein n=1 Tax=unclassified Thermococcus TaxID=2627626 RepID=UPI00143217B4|nr:MULTISPECIES: TldD/PmbA family protein [unclassified Thermococcus]NJE47650.1 TldD/PmbA family protein [Thermococcus sp. GR7]NJE78936.1 TldD/PmbA family protein [Thermococcus sp. GR4]NJF22586.1 TldD/PmbA family protein [Thermococcus sp. GR5]